MNRLWVRFSVTFGLIALLSPLFLSIFAVLFIQGGVIRILIRNELTARGSLTDQLIDYYQANGSWEGVETLIARFDRFLPLGTEGYAFQLVFMDEGQQLIYGNFSSTEENLSDAQEVIAIKIDGRTRGYLNIVQASDVVDPTPLWQSRPPILGQVSNILLNLGILSAIIGLIGGIVAGRMMATPLAHLAQTARRFGRHDFTARAEIKGSIEIREVATAFNDMARDLAQAETLRRNLVADVAHELRTPLSVLQANLQALLDGIYPLEKDEIEKLLAQTELLTRLVSELRELSQAEARQLPLQETLLNLNEVVSQVAETFQPITKNHALFLELHIPTQAMMIRGDAGRLQQVLNNLVQNAITYTPAGGCITLRLIQEAQEAFILVQDTGSGIAAEHLPHVFDRFYRADRSRSRETGGTGLGLAIAKAIIELHHGQISVTSDGIAGHGTTFTIALPVV